MSAKDLISINQNIAIFDGFTRIQGTQGMKNCERQIIPEYSSSLDAINKVLFDHKVSFCLKVVFQNDEAGCLATNLATNREHFSTSPSLALCYLFLTEKTKNA